MGKCLVFFIIIIEKHYLMSEMVFCQAAKLCMKTKFKFLTF